MNTPGLSDSVRGVFIMYVDVYSEDLLLGYGMLVAAFVQFVLQVALPAGRFLQFLVTVAYLLAQVVDTCVQAVNFRLVVKAGIDETVGPVAVLNGR